MMRKILVSVAVASAAVFPAQAVAADKPEYPDIEIPDAGGSFYLRGSAGLNIHWAREALHPAVPVSYSFDRLGYGYSWGGGFGYETGTGLRFDATMDSVEVAGLSILRTGGTAYDGRYTLMLRSTVALANVYYDFGLGEGFGYNGLSGYVGAGAGLAWNHAEVNSPVTAPIPIPTGTNVSAAAALMTGVSYDMGSWVADLGYRALWIGQINNWPTDETTESYYSIDNNWIHELRGTVRYRFN